MKRLYLLMVLAIGGLFASHLACSSSSSPTNNGGGTPTFTPTIMLTATPTKTPWTANPFPQSYSNTITTYDVPVAVTFDPSNGYMYIAEGNGTNVNGTVEIYDETQYPAVYVNSFSVAPNGSSNAYLSGIAFDPYYGDVWVADYANNDVYSLGGITDSLGNVWEDFEADNGVTFNAPWALAADAAGDVFVSDTGNFYLEEYSANENGSLMTEWGYIDFWNQLSVATDPYDNVYAGDSDLNSTGTEGVMGWAPGNYSDAYYFTLFYPSNSTFTNTNAPFYYGIAADGNYDVFTADWSNSAVEVYDYVGDPLYQYTGMGGAIDVKISPVTGDMVSVDYTNGAVYIF